MSRIFALSTLTFALTAAAPLTAWAGSKCSGFNLDKLVSAANKACGKIDGTKRFDCNADKVDKAGVDLKDWLGIWNSVANNGPATIGPRMITWTSGESGRVIAPGDRTWVSEFPTVGGATVDIDYNEGKALVNIYYCAIDADGHVTPLDSEIGVKKRDPGRRTFSAEEVDGKFLVVQVDGRKKFTHAYDYNIRIKADGKPLPAPTSDPAPIRKPLKPLPLPRR